MKAYEEVTKADSKNTTALNNLGLCYKEKGKYKEASECLEKVL